MDGNRTSNFAVPIAQGEWGPLGHRKDEEEKRRDAAGGELFYQVRVRKGIPSSIDNYFSIRSMSMSVRIGLNGKESSFSTVMGTLE